MMKNLRNLIIPLTELYFSFYIFLLLVKWLSEIALKKIMIKIKKVGMSGKVVQKTGKTT